MADGPDVFAELSPPYSTIVADPPWRYDEGWPKSNGQGQKGNTDRAALPYGAMTIEDIEALPVAEIAAPDAHLYLWTTNRYIEASYRVARAWGFRPSQLLTWAKPPRGLGPGGAFASATEFILFCRKGSLPAITRVDRTWWEWSRQGHSSKPAAFGDLVEQVSPGPHVELFARAPRLGWDAWGNGYETVPASRRPSSTGDSGR